MDRRPSLTEIALEIGASKGKGAKKGLTPLTSIYELFFAPYRDIPLTILEFGVEYGDSLRLWKRYFPHAQVLGVDIKDRRVHEEDRISIYVGDQKDPALLQQILERTGGYIDIVVDDASHYAREQIACLQHLWPHIRPGGVYVVEDTHTSYRESYGMGWRQEGTTIEYLKQLADDVSHAAHDHPVTLGQLESLHFYARTCVLVKNVSQEERAISVAGLDHSAT